MANIFTIFPGDFSYLNFPNWKQHKFIGIRKTNINPIVRGSAAYLASGRCSSIPSSLWISGPWFLMDRIEIVFLSLTFWMLPNPWVSQVKSAQIWIHQNWMCINCQELRNGKSIKKKGEWEARSSALTTKPLMSYMNKQSAWPNSVRRWSIV